jgi:ABC-type antimicrobial peptide transport system permease subunit
MIERVRRMPEVETASLARVPPGGWEGIGLGGIAPVDQAGPPETFSPAWNIIDTGYFATLRIPLLEGTDFAPSDTTGAPSTVIVSETVARRLWPGQAAIGKALRLPLMGRSENHVERLATVIGVAADIRSSSLIDGLAEPYVYLPLAQSEAMGAEDMTATMSIVVRRRGETSLAGAIAAIVQAIDRRLILARAESLDDAIALGLTPQRILATISGVMGFVALLLASMGIYGVTAYVVALRRREFAIRLALGASPARVVQLVLTQCTWLVAVGLGVGLALAIGAGQLLAIFFYGLPAAHLPTLLGTVALFFAIAATASGMPAAQAVREDAVRALQSD